MKPTHSFFGSFITLFIRLTAKSLQHEHHGQCFSASGAPNKYSESRHQNASADSPLPDAQDYDDGAVVCYAPVQYPTIQFTVAELRRRRKNGIWYPIQINHIVLRKQQGNILVVTTNNLCYHQDLCYYFYNV